jgi:hypothetical protein
MDAANVSGVIFSPQSHATPKSYLNQIHSILKKSDIYVPLCKAVSSLPQIWRELASQNPKIASLEHGLTYAECFPTWLGTGETSGLEGNMSGIVTLPLLTIIHTVQYVQYLQQTGVAHADFLRCLRSGGAQGFCAGLMAAMVVAVSKDETELIANAAKAVRISFAIGAFGEIGCDSTPLNSTTIVVRLKSGSEVEEITREFPEVRIML